MNRNIGERNIEGCNVYVSRVNIKGGEEFINSLAVRWVDTPSIILAREKEVDGSPKGVA